jgi:hypothetical protein
VIEPIWDEEGGEPIVGKLRAIVRAGDGTAVAREIPRAYLRRFAEQASARLVERGVLRAGDVFRYVISAFPVPGQVRADAPERGGFAAGRVAAGAVAVGGFAVEEVVEPMPLVDVPLAHLLGRSQLVGLGADEAAGSMPVFVPRRILAEAVTAAEQAGDVETGGVLVGRLCRDSAPAAATDGRTAPEIFVEVTAQIPAPHTRSQSTKLTFTAETWAAVHAAITLRRLDELMLGWWHFHPDFCRLRNCPVERRTRCAGASPFFSAEDIHLHATCFGSAYHVALLISDSTAAGGMTWSMYGWSQGMVAARGFHILTAGIPSTIDREVTDDRRLIDDHQVAGDQPPTTDHQQDHQTTRDPQPSEGGSHAAHTASGS